MIGQSQDDFYGGNGPFELDDQMLITDEEEFGNEFSPTSKTEEAFLRAQLGGDLLDDDENQIIEDEFNNDASWRRLPKSSRVRPFDNIYTATKVQRQTHQQDDDTVYPPDRQPPIFDFFTVLTAFVAAVILAYYTINTSWKCNNSE